ncbi:ImmA/IrrE family metallo-endopeptidase [Bacillus chungangensis]|uniref:Zn-dependent peptidase ImmA (M78 family) n=1 Tax=Bacillus chungangensis TaxID=587633 RepID=A0ABT9WS57_9BACI|nr:ImmA/IrrE family metallo-endopeptidase [Bacillus chungangensis]MDQ0176045.1 Zn-dependent peptidase ImmA (M78 family) [Bacillus chungangensis]
MSRMKEIVAKIIDKYGTNDPFEIGKARSIEFVFAELGSTFGFYSSYRRIQFIHINNKLEKTIQRFVCAHELGHAILHQDINTPFLKAHTFFSQEKIEVEANTFAVELLMTDDAIYEYKDMCLSINKLAEIYGIPREVIHLKTFSNKFF